MLISLFVLGVSTYRRGGKLVSLFPLFIVYLSCLDFVGDIAFMSVAPLAPGNREYLTILRDCLYSVASFAFLLNILALYLFFRRLAASTDEKDKPFARWREIHPGTFWTVLLLSGTGGRLMTVIHSRLLDIGKFSAPLTTRAIDQLELLGVLSVLFEDLPQLILSILITSETGTWTSVSYASIAINALGLCFGIGCRGYTAMLLSDSERAKVDAPPPEFFKVHTAFATESVKFFRYFVPSSEKTGPTASASAPGLPPGATSLEELGAADAEYKRAPELAAALKAGAHSLSTPQLLAAVGTPSDAMGDVYSAMSSGHVETYAHLATGGEGGSRGVRDWGVVNPLAGAGVGGLDVVSASSSRRRITHTGADFDITGGSHRSLRVTAMALGGPQDSATTMDRAVEAVEATAGLSPQMPSVPAPLTPLVPLTLPGAPTDSDDAPLVSSPPAATPSKRWSAASRPPSSVSPPMVGHRGAGGEVRSRSGSATGPARNSR